MLRAVLPAIAMALLLTGCNTGGDGSTTDPDKEDDFGRIEARVLVRPQDRNFYHHDVITRPATRMVRVDTAGVAVLDSVKPGLYEVYVIGQGATGRSSVLVRPRDTALVELGYSFGVTVGPDFHLDYPIMNGSAYLGDTLALRLKLFEDADRDSDIVITVTSDLDGELARGRFDKLGEAAFIFPKLSRGGHEISVRACYPDGRFRVEYFKYWYTAEPRANAISLVPEGNGVRIQWRKYRASDFQKYVLYRVAPNGYTLIPVDSFMRADDTAFLHKDPPLLEDLTYRLAIHARTIGEDWTRENTIRLPETLNFSGLADAVLHPSKPVIYAASALSGTLSKVDLAASRADSVSLDGKPGYMEIGDNGSGLELLVPTDKGWVYILDPENLAVRHRINCFSPVTSIAINGRGEMLASARTPYSLLLLSRPELTIVDALQTGYEMRLSFLPGGGSALGISHGVSPMTAFLIRLDEGAIADMRQRRSEMDEGFPGRAFALGPAGGPEAPVFLVGSGGGMFRADSTLDPVGSLPAESYSTYAFSEAGDRLYAAVSQARRIQVYRYPALSPMGEIATRGHPRRLFLRGGKLLSVSSVEAGDGPCAVETLDPEP